MPVEFVAADFVQALIRRIGEARSQALQGYERIPDAGHHDEAAYWENLLEVNASLVVAGLQRTHLRADHTVRYRFYEMTGGTLRARPFVTRRGAEVETFKRLLDWHPAPDSRTAASGRDAELLYSHFEMDRTAEGVFEYWFATQEIWATSQWAHSRVLTTAEELAQLTSQEGWRIDLLPEHCAPAVVGEGEANSHLAVLVYSPVGCQHVTLESIAIGADQVPRYGQPIAVASGPRGWVI